MIDDRQRERHYRSRVRQAAFGYRLVRSSFRKRKGWLDRLLVRLLRRATAPADPAADYMRDEIVDADELERYQNSGKH